MGTIENLQEELDLRAGARQRRRRGTQRLGVAEIKGRERQTVLCGLEIRISRRLSTSPSDGSKKYQFPGKLEIMY
jgi:hypothetical protein